MSDSAPTDDQDAIKDQRPTDGHEAPADLPALRAAMRAAHEQSQFAVGLSSPNPPVGAVVIAAEPDKSGAAGDSRPSYAGLGHTQTVGGPHAEIVALAQAGERARGATLVCTLEPCAHTGRTGPCTEAIIAAGITRVVYAVADPSPVAGGGAQRLRDAGLQVIGGLDADAVAAGTLRPWLHTQRAGGPFVTWKVGQSLDGQVAAEDGSSQWITSPEARADVHRLRGQVDAILAGAGTVRRDNPQLTARKSDGTELTRQPLRVVLSSGGRLPDNAAVLDGSTSTLLALGPGASDDQVERLRARGVDVWVSGGTPAQGIDLDALLGELARRGVLHVLIEGGPTTAGSFVAAGLIDEALIYLAPKLLLSGMWPALRGYGVSNIDEAIELELTGISRLGPDLVVRACPRPRA